MQDVWSAVAELDAVMQERLANVLETRGANLQQQAMRHLYLGDVPFPARARVLEVGCGTGVLTRMLGRWPGVELVVGVDPAPLLLRVARERAANLGNVTFEEADGRDLPFGAATFDVVVFDSTLCHVPEPGLALLEARRVLRPGGGLAIFDGDYATTTVALADNDPLQACVDAMMRQSVNDRWLVRRLPALVRSSGFEVLKVRSHGFVESAEDGYMVTVVDRGADLLRARGQIGERLTAALKAEARERAAAGTFFGHIAYGSLIARLPDARER